ncbi:MAG TPA: ureidoglycolate lyase [Rhodothermia bacterium]|nr:ureidoglycolate lyase [Rhodothermia bacterium]
MTQITSVPINIEGFSAFGDVALMLDEPPLAETAEFSFWSDSAHYRIEGETEIGFCTVYPHRANTVTWMERHERTPELLVPIDGRLVLPVMTDGDDPQVRAFEFGPGEAVVIGQNVWHSACLPLGSQGVTYFVIFRRGTPAEDVTKTNIGTVRVEFSRERG